VDIGFVGKRGKEQTLANGRNVATVTDRKGRLRDAHVTHLAV